MKKKHVLYFSDLCSDTKAFVEELEKKEIEYESVNITASMTNLKQFLKLRDTHPGFAERKKWGLVGIPLLVTKEGQYIFERADIEGTSCAPFDISK